MEKKNAAKTKSGGGAGKKKPAGGKKQAEKAKTARGGEIDAAGVELIPSGTVAAIRMQVGELLEEWEDVTENNLTLLQRRRKTGPGVTNYGFVDKVSDLAAEYPEYAHFIKIADLKNAVRNVETCRGLLLLMQSFARSVSNTMMVYATEAYQLSLDYYSQVRVRAERGDPTAIELYRILKPRFKKPRRKTGEPTLKETERNIHEILTHKKDGEVIVRGKTPKASAGKTEIIEDIHTGKAKFKGSEEGQADN